MFYCNAIGSQTEVVFDGASLIFDKDANLCKALPMFKEAMESVVLLDNGMIDAPIIEPASRMPDKELNPLTLEPELNIAQVYDALFWASAIILPRWVLPKPSSVHRAELIRR
jgi:NAD+ synthase (glutamine-hydrolysing)